jgi:hypothetical protein
VCVVVPYLQVLPRGGSAGEMAQQRTDLVKQERLLALIKEHGHGRDENGRKRKIAERGKLLIFTATKARCVRRLQTVARRSACAGVQPRQA